MSEANRIRLMVVIAGLLLVSFISSCSELGYALKGKSAEAQLIDVQQVQVKTGRRSHPRLQVSYYFQEPDGTRRTESDHVSLNFVPEISESADGTKLVAIQYRPGWPNKSRLKGHDEMVWVYIFLGSLAAGAASVGWFLYTFYKT